MDSLWILCGFCAASGCRYWMPVIGCQLVWVFPFRLFSFIMIVGQERYSTSEVRSSKRWTRAEFCG